MQQYIDISRGAAKDPRGRCRLLQHATFARHHRAAGWSLLGLAGTHGPRADGQISLSHPLGPASRVLPHGGAGPGRHQAPAAASLHAGRRGGRRRAPPAQRAGDRHDRGHHAAGHAQLGVGALESGPTIAGRRWCCPGGRTAAAGWIRLDGRLRIHTAYWVRADLSSRTVTLMKGRRPRIVFRAAIGAASTPTPTGKLLRHRPVATGDPYGPFGWFAFGLSGHQPNLPAGWSGGDQLAIHGTNAPSSIGTAASAGCLRVSAAALSHARRYLRLGTPVVIRR